jgi:predicted transcriptional regulator
VTKIVNSFDFEIDEEKVILWDSMVAVEKDFKGKGFEFVSSSARPGQLIKVETGNICRAIRNGVLFGVTGNQGVENRRPGIFARGGMSQKRGMGCKIMGFVATFLTTSRVKALDALLRAPDGELTISQLTTEANSNHRYIHKAINVLTREGLVETKQFGRFLLVRLTHDGHGQDSQKVALLRQLFSTLEKE